MSQFALANSVGDARAGQLRCQETKLETPHLFPVVNFYCGGTNSSLFGGGIFRTIKEFLAADPGTTYGEDYSEYFRGVMTSVASLTDFGLSKERYLAYLETPVQERPEFDDFDGVLFVDSGGYKILQKGGLTGSNFEIETSQKLVAGLQRSFGADITVNLDTPFEEGDSYRSRVQKTEETAAYAHEFATMDSKRESMRYLTVHGYDRAMLDRFFDTVSRTLPGPIDQFYDGIALGSLVPKKNDLEALIQAVQALRAVVSERRLEHLPIHVLGISGRAIPLLVALGADSFDSATYLHMAINGKYSTSLFETVPLDSAPFGDCNCPVCSTSELREQMNGNAEYQKDVLGPVAVHNLIVQQTAVTELRELVRAGDEDAFRAYLEDLYRDQKGARKFAYRVINETIEPYF